MKNREKLLEVKHLQACFPTQRGEVKAINDVSFSIDKGEIVALVGESGSGKSVTALSVIGLNTPSIKYEKNSDISFKGKNLISMKKKQMKKIRGNEISMIFQDPLSSLNPLHPIGRQIAEPIQLHQGLSYIKSREKVIDLLKKVGIPEPEKRLKDYPHQLSGGMRQRIMIAMALACNPSLLIADEPTTALDVTIQAQILNVMRELQKDTGISILLITHDLGVVAEMADRVLVMYGGEIVEEGDVFSIFQNPKHPYTEGLLSSVPKLRGASENRLRTIPGTVPNPLELPKGCNFQTRCSYATEQCSDLSPQLVSNEMNGKVACWHPLEKVNKKVTNFV
ncbi:ABC transporter ATP-binding protein [Cytobacillus purgationiresistens]|uniref:Oligopeptide/dipeptide ABC transporter ATP-binding protein n=1 Tax=Cytobacillus purgationiresistens TaxID=863449 RepID=A0ABU0AQG5_9BACI|nr:ABC transporter ATP-binding protein [Cytobacillus purgationiresistens]MDQ0272643.1 oligopeptide/dipeptide ABC transporter ATP-binding protein [Cytobacillus purgationiresistens]